MLDENQSKLSEDLMEFRRDASMLNVRMGPGLELPGSAPAWASLQWGEPLGRAFCSKAWPFDRGIVPRRQGDEQIQAVW